MSGMELESNRLLSFAPTRSRRFGLPSHGAWPLSPATFPALTPALLARAGWYFTPSKTSPDQVTCFLCKKSLGGWEPTDDAFVEHVGHGRDCGWAGTRCQVEVRRRAEGGVDQDDEGEGVRWSLEDEGGTRPAELEKARKATFGKWWPHDRVKGWTPTSSAMSKAGFVFTPTAEAPDLATCLYCALGLDGWEIHDDPFKEHLKRTPKCPFFAAVSSASSSSRSASAPSSNAAGVTKGGKRTAKTGTKQRVPSSGSAEEATEDDEDAFEIIDMPSPPAAKTPKPTRSSRQSKAPSTTTGTALTSSRAARTRTTTAQTPASSISTAKTKVKSAKTSVPTAPAKEDKPLPPSPERESSPGNENGDEGGASRRPSPNPKPASKTRKPAKAAKGKAAAPTLARVASPVGDEASDEGAVDEDLDIDSTDQAPMPRSKPVTGKKGKAPAVVVAESKTKSRSKKAAHAVVAPFETGDDALEEEEPRKDVESSGPSTLRSPPGDKAVHEREVSGSSALTSLPSSSTSATFVKAVPLPARPSSSSSSVAMSSTKPPSLGRGLSVRSPPAPLHSARPTPMSLQSTAASVSTETPNAGTPSRLPVRSNVVSPRSPQQLHQQQHPGLSFGQVSSAVANPPPARPHDDVFSASAAPPAPKAAAVPATISSKASSSRVGPPHATASTSVAQPAADDDELDLDPAVEAETGDDLDSADAREPFDDEELDVQSWLQQAFRRQADEMAEEHERAKQAFIEHALEARRLIEEESCDESGVELDESE